MQLNFSAVEKNCNYVYIKMSIKTVRFVPERCNHLYGNVKLDFHCRRIFTCVNRIRDELAKK